MVIRITLLCILLAAPVALWGVLCALNATNIRTTRPGIAAGFLFCAMGWAALIAAALDYLIGDAPLFWPLVMLLGVLLLSIGNAVIYLLNLRSCGCPACPARIVHLKEFRHG